MIVWIGKILASPIVANILVPALRGAVSDWLAKTAARVETKGALKQAKAAQTAEEFRDASKRLSDSTGGERD